MFKAIGQVCCTWAQRARTDGPCARLLLLQSLLLLASPGNALQLGQVVVLEQSQLLLHLVWPRPCQIDAYSPSIDDVLRASGQLQDMPDCSIHGLAGFLMHPNQANVLATCGHGGLPCVAERSPSRVSQNHSSS